MQPGDIVFTVESPNEKPSTESSWSSIHFAQSLMTKIFDLKSPDTPVICAAIAVSKDCVIESIGRGTAVTDLSLKKNHTAIIFSGLNPNVANSAAWAANQFFSHAVEITIQDSCSTWRSLLPALESLNNYSEIKDRINESAPIETGELFSQFIVNCFEAGNLIAAENLIPAPPRIFTKTTSTITTPELALQCDNNGRFYFSGFWRDGVEVRL